MPAGPVAASSAQPLWPDGTDVAQQPDLKSYLVTLPGGTQLTVDESTGDSFSASGVIDDNPAPFEVEARLPTKIGSFLAYCDVKALPVAFADAATFSVHGR
ncbi:hypothetical protein C1I95_21170 [Micromonospora craterilacus]|uniref:Uncharacterized protein n=1 Tax=Micromonospora craterilacus TaxID=1655439 RepID=A0A2W2DRT3_9ACTN|nr:hypothetical protein [Micromonospora craterilacus]PZG14696.1 hypothetical protein C1I95_21170 [Micromonospora craterilacus]